MNIQMCPVKTNIIESEKTEYPSGDKGCTIYCSIKNSMNQKIDIEIKDSFIVNNQGEQHIKENYLTGYIVDGENTIQAQVMLVRGEVYIEETSGELQPGWVYGISILNKATEETYEWLFQFDDNNQWTCISFDSVESMANQLKKKVERIVQWEERRHIRIDHISFRKLYEGCVYIYFDVFSDGSDSLEEDIYIQCVVYDKDNCILDNKSERIRKEEFYGFKSTHIDMSVDENKVGRIMLFPE